MRTTDFDNPVLIGPQDIRRLELFRFPAYGVFAVDRKGNVWVQAFDYMETSV